MVIQFSCPACQQPIEVDDEWGGQHVACPFCERVVTTPTESTLEGIDATVPPVARKLAPPATSDGAAAVQQVGVNRLAIVGLCFSLGAILLTVCSMILFSPVVQQVGPNATPEEVQKKVTELLADAELSSRIVLGVGLLCLSFAFWLTGLILCVVAATRRHLALQHLAVVGIVFSILLPLLICLGSVFG